jgi:hypothetical protein
MMLSRMRKGHFGTAELRCRGPLAQDENTLQETQKRLSGKAAAGEGLGDTYRTSCGPFALAMSPGERESPSSVSDTREIPPHP